MSTNIRKFPPHDPSSSPAGPTDGWGEAEEYLSRQIWPEAGPDAAQALAVRPTQERTPLTNGLTDSIAVRRAAATSQLGRQAMPVVHALQHLCELMSEVLEETSLQSLVLNGTIKPQEAIMLREAVQWLDRKMSASTH